MVISDYAGGVAPSSVSAAQDGTTITVTWAPPTPAPSVGYMVYYSTTGDERSVSVSNGSDSQAVITCQQADHVYTVSVVAVYVHLPSTLTTVPAVRPGIYNYILYGGMSFCVVSIFYLPSVQITAVLVVRPGTYTERLDIMLPLLLPECL